MKKLYIVLLCIIVVCLSLLSSSSGVAFAVGETSGSNVLDDLSVDVSFSTENYPVDNTDYGIYVFQIAESTDNELLIYTYQPCVEKDFRATSINFSTTPENDPDYSKYNLKFLNSAGTLYKYKVEDFTVSSEGTRYYVISSISRPWVTSIDGEGSDPSQTYNSKAYSVSERWAIGRVNGNVFYQRVTIKTVDVETKHVGFVRYTNGITWFVGTNYVDCHYVAFNTSYSIDRLISAKVSFNKQAYWETYTYQSVPHYGDIVHDEVTIDESDPAVRNTNSGFFVEQYEWDRIQTVSEFIESNNAKYIVIDGGFVDLTSETELSASARATIQEMSWVLRFYETPFTLSYSGNYDEYVSDSVRVSEVSLLQLEFEADGEYYNLGVIDNEQTGSLTPDNQRTYKLELDDDFKDFLEILMLIIGVLVLCIALPYIIKFFGAVFKIVFAPFRWLFGGASGRSHTSNNKRR